MSSVAITDKENVTSNENVDSKTDGQEGDGDNVQEANVEKTEEDDTSKTEEKVADEHLEGEQLEGETLKGEGEENEEEDKIDLVVEGEGNDEDGVEVGGDADEVADPEQTKDEEEMEGEEKSEEGKEDEAIVEENVEEEEPEYVEGPVDPAAPLNLTDSKEAVRPEFEIRPEQLAEVEKLWELFQDYTPAYTDIVDYITVKELVYMLDALLLMTYTEEQLMELVTFVCRPPDENGHISYDQYLRMVKIRLRDLDIEEELRLALRVLDPGKTGEVESDELREVLGKLGNKLPSKMIDEFIKEIDLSGEGKIGIEDVVAICGMDLKKDDILMPTSEPEEDAPE